MAKRKLYQLLATHLNAIENCRGDNMAWFEKHTDIVFDLVGEHMPSGSGFDNKTHIDMERSKKGDRLVFTTAFHHMNSDGYYDGWTEHTVTIRPCLAFGISLTVSGINKNDIKDYIEECFQHALMLELEPDGGSYKLAA